MEYDILLTGVGGQGVVLASRLLAAAAIESGVLARTSETIGMAQRGGSVTSHVRIGNNKKSAIVPDGKADLLIGFEPAEVARNIHKLAPGGKCIVNKQPIQSVVSALSGTYKNPEEVLSYIAASIPNTIFVDGINLAGGPQFIKTLNIILLGVATGAEFLPFTKENMVNAIKANVPQRFLEMNLKAFEVGTSFSLKI